MSVINLTLPDGELAVTGKQVTFIAPCNSTDAEGLKVNGVDYLIVDTYGDTVSGISNLWRENSILSVLLDAENRKAYLLSLASNSDYFKGILPVSKGGTGAETIEGVLKNLGITNATRIVFGSYIGTGKYGESFPTSITFDSEPLFVFVRGADSILCTEALTQTPKQQSCWKDSSTMMYFYMSADRKTLYYYSAITENVSSAAGFQFNSSNAKYSYFAFLK